MATTLERPRSLKRSLCSICQQIEHIWSGERRDEDIDLGPIMLRLNEGTGSYTAQKTGKVDHHFNPLRIAGEYLIIPNATKANVHDGLMRWCRNKQVVCLHLCFPRQSKIVALEKSAGGSMKVYLRSWQPPR